jgi:hypothetical protein
MAKIKTHYENLQVARNASPEVIKGAYKFLCQKYHPDKYSGDRAEAERILKIINAAYDVLSNATLRAEHDEWIRQQEDKRNPQDAQVGQESNEQTRRGTGQFYPRINKKIDSEKSRQKPAPALTVDSSRSFRFIIAFLISGAGGTTISWLTTSSWLATFHSSSPDFFVLSCAYSIPFILYIAIAKESFFSRIAFSISFIALILVIGVIASAIEKIGAWAGGNSAEETSPGTVALVAPAPVIPDKIKTLGKCERVYIMMGHLSQMQNNVGMAKNMFYRASRVTSAWAFLSEKYGRVPGAVMEQVSGFQRTEKPYLDADYNYLVQRTLECDSTTQALVTEARERSNTVEGRSFDDWQKEIFAEYTSAL